MKHTFLRLVFLGSLILFVGQGCLSFGGSDEPQTVGPAGMFVSTDTGETWQSISKLPQAEGVQDLSGVSVYRLFQDPQDPQAMYWASRSQGLFYTFNSGKTWQHAENELSSGFVYGVAIHPNDTCNIFTVKSQALYRTSDCNRNWTELYREEGNGRLASVAIQSASPYHLFLMKSDGRVLKSEDAGISWQNISRISGRTIDMLSDPHHGNTFFIATKDRGLWRSDDAGQTWNDVTEGLERLSGANEYRRLWISPVNAGHIFYVSSYGIHKSTDNGDTWETPELIHPPGSARIYGIGVNAQNENEIYYTATINTRSTFYKTVDGGKNWITKRVPSGQIPSAMFVHTENTDWVYLGFTIPPQN